MAEVIEPTPAADELLLIREAAELLGRHENTVRRWVAEGTIPSIRIGYYFQIRRSDVEEILRNGTRPRGSAA
ncbi:helix-turn-helix domain-containing protein [Mycolicibacterium thermoresistibile]